ncbi:hypothetical protein [uncultured Winogradskyella sp.]|uniref:hypothetical protein n=1 Tax=uncultured Winogradskyella sp. TaxID=395353 RepID=UPI00263797FB|nr:hypothetical protein [uncultured Winogradskyella sp.]
MKNVRYIFVLLLIVNCTTDLSEIEENSAITNPTAELQTCIDDLPKVRLTNNGTRSFDFIVYGQDYSILHTQNISSTTDSGWVELSDNDVIVVVTNNVDYGQKVPLSLVECDNKELEIDINNILVEL